MDLKSNLFIGDLLCLVLGSALLVDPSPVKLLMIKYTEAAQGSAG